MVHSPQSIACTCSTPNNKAVSIDYPRLLFDIFRFQLSKKNLSFKFFPSTLSIMLKKPSVLFFIALLFTVSGCRINKTNTTKPGQARDLSQAWKDYWYGGVAELNQYALQQARYGEIHKGDAVLIFVTEDFLKDRQVKYEGGPKDRMSVLKLNATKKFWTGIYPYSLMTSVFTPIAASKPSLKVTTTAQEWCGHSFSQLNLKGNHYEGLLRSYFMNEGDENFRLEKAFLEDEIWNLIRLNPEALPTGNIEMVPGTQFLRLRHRKFGVEKAKATLTKDKATGICNYHLDYQDFNRVLEITFKTEFPHQIMGWKETSGSGRDAALTTRASLTHTLKSPYWRKNSRADSVLRFELKD